MAQTKDNMEKAEAIAGSEGGDTAPAPQQRAQSHDPNKMENELEMQKENKQGLDSADQVAGRGEKGSATGLLQKLTGDPKEKGRDVSK